MNRAGHWQRIASLATLLLVAVVAPVAAQTFDLGALGGKKPGSTPKAEFIAHLAPETVHPGDEVTFAITAKLPAGYHIYGTEKSFAGGTRIDVTLNGLDPVDEEFTPDHPGKTHFAPEFNADVTEFYGTVTWSRKFRVQADATSIAVIGTLKGQYCSDPDAGGQCIQIIPPFRIDLKVTVEPGAAMPSSASYAVKERPTRPRQGASAPDPVEYEFRLSPPNASRGDTVTLWVTAWLDAGWHTYSLSQTGDGAAPTEINVDVAHNLKPVGDGFQADHPFTPRNSNGDLLEEYHDRVTWSRQYEVTAEQPGDYGVSGTLTYAVCDARKCLPVKQIKLSLGASSESAAASDAEGSPFGVTSVEVKKDQPPVRANAVELPREAAPKHRELQAAAAVAPIANPQNVPLMAFLLLCVGGGFAAMLTPCAFPMVPITVSFFLKQSELQHRRPWLIALVYCGTIVLTFTVLGVGIAAIFGATKLNALANNPWLNLMISGVFIAFALNMLGAFEIHIPSQWLTWSASHEATGGYVGAIFMAITFTLTSFTCTFAVAGTLLVTAAKGELYRPVVGMLAFGSAFALPFLVLALAPGLLKKLPKSGGWMNSVKVVMGLIEIGAAVKFLSVADLIWNPRPMLFDFVTTMLIWTVLSLAIGLYLLGLFRLSHDTPVESISTIRGLLALSFLGLTALLTFLVFEPDRAEGFVMDQIVAFAPPHFDSGQAVSASPDLGPVVAHNGLVFALDLDKAISVAEHRQRPLLLDFTGVTCSNCRRMEKKMAESANRQRIEKYVAVALYTDRVPEIENAGYAAGLLEKNTQLQVQWFGDVTLPSYAVVTPDGKTVLASYVGYEARAGEFTQFLDSGWQKWQALAGPRDQAPATIASQVR